VSDAPADAAAPEAESVSGLSPEYIDSIVDALEKDDFATAKSLAQPLHYADLADLIETLDAEKREKLVALLRDDFDPVVLTELDETVREQVIEQLGMPQVAEAVAEMDSDDALFVLGELEPRERD